MKKIAFLILVFFSLPHLIFAQNNKVKDLLKRSALKSNAAIYQLIDSVHFWSFDTAMQVWNTIPYQRVVNITYDANFNMTGSETQFYYSGIWMNSDKEINTYNANNDLIAVVQQVWNGSTWINAQQNIYTYDISHNVLTRTEQSWSGSAWMNDARITYTYNANNDILTHKIEFYSGGFWENAYLTTNTYDANNNLMTYMYQSWDMGGWNNEDFYTYTYDANNNMLTEIYQIGSGTSWTNFNRSSFTYNGNNLMERLNENWSGSMWNALSRVQYDYDVNNNRIMMLNEFYSGGNFVPISRYLYTYDLLNRMIGENFQTWSGTAWEDSTRIMYTYNSAAVTEVHVQSWNGISWVNSYIQTTQYDADGFSYAYAFKTWSFSGNMVQSGDSLYLYYHTVTPVDEKMESSLLIYPNPATNNVTLILPHAGDIIYIELYDNTGRKIMTEHTNNSISFNLKIPDAVKAGNYVLKLRTGKESFSSLIQVVR